MRHFRLVALLRHAGRLVRSWVLVSMAVAAAFLVLWLGHASSAAVPSAPSEPAHVAIEAFADQQSVAPGHTFRVALVEHIQPGWHTYWINPGDAGQATKLNWTLPEGYRVAEVQWPVPQVFRSGALVTYGYEGKAVLLQDVQAPDRLGAAPVQLSVEAQWLACQDVCIPEHGVAHVTVRQEPLAAHPVPTVPPAFFVAAAERLPKPSPWPASLAVNATDIVLRVGGIVRQLSSVAEVQFLPLTWGEIDNAAPQHSRRAGADLILTLKRGDLRSSPIEKLDGVLVLGLGGGALQGQGYLLHALAGDASAPPVR
jgi:DsbC/DsbD-like thiol-disulfide interchange protein